VDARCLVVAALAGSLANVSIPYASALSLAQDLAQAAASRRLGRIEDGEGRQRAEESRLFLLRRKSPGRASRRRAAQAKLQTEITVLLFCLIVCLGLLFEFWAIVRDCASTPHGCVRQI